MPSPRAARYVVGARPSPAGAGVTHHHDHAAHEHDHDHAHGGAGDQVRRLWIALAITAAFLVAEVVGGILSNSLALLADAGHMLADVAALALSLFVAWFSRQPHEPRRTYGYLRWEILAAFINGATLLLLSAWIAIEAVLRLRNPEPVESGLMLAVAIVGILANIGAAAILHPASEASLNLRGAYLHVVGDLLGSVATVVAALLVRFTGWLAADPVASILMTLLIVRGAWRLVRESVDVLLESTPSHISVGACASSSKSSPESSRCTIFTCGR